MKEASEPRSLSPEEICTLAALLPTATEQEAEEIKRQLVDGFFREPEATPHQG